MNNRSSFTPLLLFALLAVVAWLMLIRPQRNRMRQMREMQTQLSVGAEVMTTAGLYGTIAAVDDQTVILEVAPGVTNRYTRAAIARVITSGEQAPEPMDEDGPTGS